MSDTYTKPLSRQRSEWLPQQPVNILGVTCAVWKRNVHDGHLTVMIGDEPHGLHMSISHRTNHNPPKPGRYPAWDEIAHARYQLLPDNLDFVMHLPPPSEYVAVHDTTFHLRQHPEVQQSCQCRKNETTSKWRVTG